MPIKKIFFCSYNTIKTFMQDGDTKVDLGAGKHTLAASGAGKKTQEHVDY